MVLVALVFIRNASQLFVPMNSMAGNGSCLFNSTVLEEVIVEVRLVFSILSFIGSLVVIGLIWLLKRYKFFTQRLIMYLGIAALISSIAYILGRVKYHISHDFCVFSGFFLLTSDWSLLLCVVSITINLTLKLTFHINTDRLEIVYVLVSFLSPLLITWIPFVNDAYGPSAAWCWIRGYQDNCSSATVYETVLQFALWYVPLYLIIAILFVTYLYVIVKVHVQSKRWHGRFDPVEQQQKDELKDEIKPLIRYPLIYLAIAFFPFINRIAIAFHAAIFVLYLLHVATAPLTGALIAVAYAVDTETLKQLKWSKIKAHILFRSTSDVVQPYSVDSEKEQEIEGSVTLSSSAKYHAVPEYPNDN